MKNPNAKFHAPEHDHRYEQAVNEHEDREAGKHANSWWITYIPEPIEPAAPAQAQHSPLPWKDEPETDYERAKVVGRVDNVLAEVFGTSRDERSANASFIVRACNNAQRLADALANLVRPLDKGWKVSGMDVRIREANEALAEWSKHNE